MKKTATKLLAVILSFVFILCLVSCNKTSEEAKSGIWENAAYTQNETVGEGSKEITVDIIAEDKTVTLTVKTDKATLGEALFALGLINDASFFDVLIGIKADWNKDKAYWAFYKGDEMMNAGVNDAEISGGEYYRFVYTK